VRSFSATFLRLLETYGFLHRNRKNVVYSRNVMRNKKLEIFGRSAALHGGANIKKLLKYGLTLFS
jgi:hypothetical protein